MITEQQLLDFMRETAYKPMTYQELEQHFAIEEATDFKAFLKLLNQMEDEGKILRTRNERYGVPERMNLLRGRIQAHMKGFAFLLPDDKEHPDVYLHANDLKSAMNGDTVLVRVTSQSEGGGRMEGEVVRVVHRAVTQIVGTFDNHETFGFVIPDDKRINRDLFVPRESFKGAVSGQKVVARIVTYPEGRSAAQGEIIEILGHKDDPGVDILSIIRKHQLPESFPEEVLKEAESAPDSITEEEIVAQGRRDLRSKMIVTIDGEDAKDLDDAVNVERLENGNYLLGVHIADVTYYVREKSELDKEAFMRGTSVYLVDRVIPMLPHRLSNGICSLNPQVDRLTLSCEMEFEAGTMKRVRHDVFTSVIKTAERMTYSNVRKILAEDEADIDLTVAVDETPEDRGSQQDDSEESGNRNKGTKQQTNAEDIEQLESWDAQWQGNYDPEAARELKLQQQRDIEARRIEKAELRERYAALVPMFELMEELAMKLRRKRMKRGAIDFDFQESKIIVDSEGKAIDIVKRERSVAEQIIEEFMLAANETVAEHFHWLRVPFLYRIHEDPDSEKLVHFLQFASNFGYVVKGKGGSAIHPRALQTLLEEIRGTKEETVISTMMLRSMKQAKYDAESLGHFGLAAEFYSHFTSPIRRYPDLMIHRVIREVLENGGALSEKRHEALQARMPDIAKHSSERERLAVDAERDTEQLKKCEYMLDKVGEIFTGMISSVTSFGFFVELDNTVEGLIRLSDLNDDYYHFSEQHMVLIGERTSKVYRIGDEVKIRIARVNMDEHTIDFEMVDVKPRGGYKGVADAGIARKGGRGRSGGFGRAGRDEGRSVGGGRGAAVGKRGGSGTGGAGRGDASGRRAKPGAAAAGGSSTTASGRAEAGSRENRGRGQQGGVSRSGDQAGPRNGRPRGEQAEGDKRHRGANAERSGTKGKGGEGIRTDMWGLPIREGRSSGNRNADAAREGGASEGAAFMENPWHVPAQPSGKRPAKSGSGAESARPEGSHKKKRSGNATAAFVRKKRK